MSRVLCTACAFAFNDETFGCVFNDPLFGPAVTAQGVVFLSGVVIMEIKKAGMRKGDAVSRFEPYREHVAGKERAGEDFVGDLDATCFWGDRSKRRGV